MMTDAQFTIYEKVMEFLAAGFMSAFGGIAAYVYQNVKSDRPFKLTSFATSSFLSFFVGNFVGSFVPHTFEYRDGILMLAGFSAWPLLGLVEMYGKDWISQWIAKKMDVNVISPQNPQIPLEPPVPVPTTSLPAPVAPTPTILPPTPMTKDVN
jgi:hypothetical protein